MVMSVSVEVGRDTQCEVRLSEQMHHTICICGRGWLGPVDVLMLLCLSPQNFLLTHLWSTALRNRLVVRARRRIAQLPHTPSRCVFVCVVLILSLWLSFCAQRGSSNCGSVITLCPQT